jgi:hypothetical protein
MRMGMKPARRGPRIRRMKDPSDLQEMGEHLPDSKAIRYPNEGSAFSMS